MRFDLCFVPTYPIIFPFSFALSLLPLLALSYIPPLSCPLHLSSSGSLLYPSSTLSSPPFFFWLSPISLLYVVLSTFLLLALSYIPPLPCPLHLFSSGSLLYPSSTLSSPPFFFWLSPISLLYLVLSTFFLLALSYIPPLLCPLHLSSSGSLLYPSSTLSSPPFFFWLSPISLLYVVLSTFLLLALSYIPPLPCPLHLFSSGSLLYPSSTLSSPPFFFWLSPISLLYLVLSTFFLLALSYIPPLPCPLHLFSSGSLLYPSSTLSYPPFFFWLSPISLLYLVLSTFFLLALSYIPPLPCPLHLFSSGSLLYPSSTLSSPPFFFWLSPISLLYLVLSTFFLLALSYIPPLPCPLHLFSSGSLLYPSSTLSSPPFFFWLSPISLINLVLSTFFLLALSYIPPLLCPLHLFSSGSLLYPSSTLSSPPFFFWLSPISLLYLVLSTFFLLALSYIPPLRCPLHLSSSGSLLYPSSTLSSPPFFFCLSPISLLYLVLSTFFLLALSYIPPLRCPLHLFSSGSLLYPSSTLSSPPFFFWLSPISLLYVVLSTFFLLALSYIPPLPCPLHLFSSGSLLYPSSTLSSPPFFFWLSPISLLYFVLSTFFLLALSYIPPLPCPLHLFSSGSLLYPSSTLSSPPVFFWLSPISLLYVVLSTFFLLALSYIPPLSCPLHLSSSGSLLYPSSTLSSPPFFFWLSPISLLYVVLSTFLLLALSYIPPLPCPLHLFSSGSLLYPSSTLSSPPFFFWLSPISLLYLVLSTFFLLALSYIPPLPCPLHLFSSGSLLYPSSTLSSPPFFFWLSPISLLYLVLSTFLLLALSYIPPLPCPLHLSSFGFLRCASSLVSSNVDCTRIVP